MSQVSCYRTKRPVTASPNNGRARVPLSPSSSTTGGGGLLAAGEQIKRFRSEFPNLPGFSRHALLRPQSPKNQSLNFKNGYMMVNTPLPNERLSLFNLEVPSLLQRPITAPASSSLLSSSSLSKEVHSPNDVSGRYSLFRQRKDRENNNISLPFCPSSKLPAFIENDRRVLLFNAYYEEEVLQSAIEQRRVMICDIFFYVEDGTIEIIQKKQENSGIPLGVYLRRSKVEKPKRQLNNEDENTGSRIEYYEIDDFKIGNKVEIYSRIFHILDCNESTREYVIKHHGWQQIDVHPLPYPRDWYAEANKAKMKRESGVPGVDRKRKMHDLKKVMESMLGKQSSTTDRGMFLQCGQEALCFEAAWDDRERLYGDVQYFRLFYYLADDTIEILPVHKKNDGRYPFPKLLKRMKLPKSDNFPHNDEGTVYYNWKELSIGVSINVFGRTMQLARCDYFTREYYKKHGIQLKENMSLEPEVEKIRFERQIPPYNGFGSEEDSLRSCTGGINPPPPKRDLARMREKQGVILRFNARLLSDKTNRRFVIQYFMEDDTIAIREPPIRNSGVMGGNFLRRQEVKKHDGTKYLANDMFIGNIVDFMCHHFELLNADEYSYRLMENDPNTFPYCNFSSINDIVLEKKNNLSKYFAVDYKGDGYVDLPELAKALESVGLKLNKQQILTFWRKIDKKSKGRVSFTKIIKHLENPVDTAVE